MSAELRDLAVRAAATLHVIVVHGLRLDGRCTCGTDCGRNAGKHPVHAGWTTRPRLTPAEAVDALARGYNLGARCGAVEDLVVVDVDIRADTRGDLSLEELQAEHAGGRPFETATQRTGSGGRSYLFRWPAVDVPRKINLRPGLDLLGRGSQFVVAPSRHRSGRHYTWQIGCAPWEVPPAPLPPWLLALARAPVATPARPATGELEIVEGERNHRLFRIACGLRQGGWSHAAILVALRGLNATQVQPPLPERELQLIAESAARHPAGTHWAAA